MIEQLLGPRGSARRTLALSIVAALAGFLSTKFVLPGSGRGNGTPNGVYFRGAVSGSLQALTAMGIVLIYRTSRFVSFAQAALGAAGAVFAYNMISIHHVPFGVGLACGIIVSAFLGVLTELFLRKFFQAPRLVVTIVTIGIAGLLAGAPNQIQALPIWGDNRDLAQRFGAVAVDPFPDFGITPFGKAFEITFEQLFALGLVLVAVLGIGAFFRFTKMGIAVRASAENADRAELLGINVKILSTVVWAIAGGLAGAGVTMVGTLGSFSIAGEAAPEVLIVALAAGVLAKMRSLPMAAFAAIGITIIQEALRWSYAGAADIIKACLVLVILAGLTAQRKQLARSEEASSWEATQEVRSTPKELLAIGSVRNWRYILMGIGILAVLIYPFAVTTGLQNQGGLVAITGIVLVSLVVLTGWAGQVSLGQFGLVCIGAVAGGNIVGRTGLPFIVALLAAGLATAIVSVIIGLPALRIKGLFLGVTTFALAFAVHAVVFTEKVREKVIPDEIRRPRFFLFDFDDERSMYYLCLLTLVLCVLVVAGLRRTRPGRIMIALRENENELAAFGINVVRTKLMAFAVSGMFCGIAGGLLAMHQRAITENLFGPIESLNVFIYAVLGGVGSVSGAMLGAAFKAFESFLPTDAGIGFILNINTILLVVMFFFPSGFSGVVYALRDGVLRIVAQRRQLVVPSLFADVDPDALSRRLVPLAAASDGTGMTALSAKRFRLSSELYGASAEEQTSKRPPDDGKAIGAAAGSLAAAENN